MRQKQPSRRFPRWSLPFIFLLAIGAGKAGAQPGRGPALVIKGIAQYEDSARFRPAIASLEEAVKSGELDSRDSTRAYFYLGFCYFKLGQPEDGSRFFRIVVQRNPRARLPEGAEEFADSLERIRQQVKQGIVAPVGQLSPHPADSTPAHPAQSLPESIYVKYPVYVQPRLGNYLAGASAGAILGLASYFTSVHFDNLAAAKVKAYSMAGDSADAEELKAKARQYHSLGSAFYYSSYPLIAVGFYVGLKLSEKVFPGKVAFLGDDSPTRVYCALDEDIKLSLGVRRSIW